MFGVINSTPYSLLVQWIIQKHLNRVGKQYFKGRLIDIGCGIKPYQDMLSPYVEEHVGVDHEQTLHV
jgi:hypothetical protein